MKNNFLTLASFFLFLSLGFKPDKLQVIFNNIGFDSSENIFLSYSCKNYKNETIVFFIKKVNSDSVYVINRSNLHKYEYSNGNKIYLDQFGIPLKANKVDILVVVKNDTIRHLTRTIRPSMDKHATRKVEFAKDYIIKINN